MEDTIRSKSSLNSRTRQASGYRGAWNTVGLLFGWKYYPVHNEL